MASKILIVDDEPDIRESIGHYLGKRGYEIITADNGKQAISKLLTEKPDLIILDMRMPEIDGIECLRIIKTLERDVIVIMVTAVTDLDTAKHTLELGAADYITKPIGFNGLETAITAQLLLRRPK
jgi:DNA-binding response OmpR family regulator